MHPTNMYCVCIKAWYIVFLCAIVVHKLLKIQFSHDIVYSPIVCVSSHTVYSHVTRSPSHQQQLMTLAATDSSISPALPQRLLVPVLQMLHSAAQSGTLSQPMLRDYLDEFSCRFNYAAIHSATPSVSQCVWGLQLEDHAEGT